MGAGFTGLVTGWFSVSWRDRDNDVNIRLLCLLPKVTETGMGHGGACAVKTNA
jgi:hypothetical protein